MNWSRGQTRGDKSRAACGGAAMVAPQHAAHVWPRAARGRTAVHLRRAPRPQPVARKSHNIEEVNVQLLIASTSIFSQEFKFDNC